MDCTDGSCFGKPQLEDKSDAKDSSSRFVEEVVKARMPTDRNATHYNMKHNKNRGIALIFNHESFSVRGEKLDKREGTNVDATSMEKILKNLNFNATVHNDLKLAEIKQCVNKTAKLLNHNDFDCFVLVVLTHGCEDDMLYASNSKYSFDILWTPFSADRCPSLAGKPKLFFTQACRGNKLMAPVDLIRTEVDGLCKQYRIPSKADFLFAYSSIPGYFSWRNTKRGSWFIKALCEELEENAYNYDILTLLTFVIRKVAIDYESYVPLKPEMHERKQIPKGGREIRFSCSTQISKTNKAEEILKTVSESLSLILQIGCFSKKNIAKNLF